MTAKAKLVHVNDVAACPITSLAPAHYRVRDDGGVECACGKGCEWFGLVGGYVPIELADCDRPATGFREHPALPDVPICDRCRDRMEAS